METSGIWDITIRHNTKAGFHTRSNEAQVETMKGKAHNHNDRKTWGRDMKLPDKRGETRLQNKSWHDKIKERTEVKGANLK